MTRVTETEWLTELAKLSVRSDAGYTTVEWAEKLGGSLDMARRKLREAHRLGWLIAGKRTGTAINGRAINSDVYRIVKPKK